MVVMLSLAAKGSEPTGASLAWTLNDPVIVRARALVKEGKFTRAEAELELSESVDPEARAEMLEMISRLRYEYSVSPTAMLAKLADSLPGTTAADVERWRGDGGLQSRMIDGKPAFFRREPANLFRFCGEAKERKVSGKADGAGWVLADHLKRVITAADKGGGLEVEPVRHRVTYSLTVPAHVAGLKVGAVVRVWLPFAQEYRQQGEIKLISASPQPVAMAKAPQKAAYFEVRVSDPEKPLVFSETFEFTSSAYYPALDESKARPLSASYAEGNLGERPPHIVFTPELKAIVAQVTAGQANPLAKARSIFRWIDGNIAYHAEEEYGVIPSLTAKALATRRGDCGIQSMLFIAMCRWAGIPARWQSGWQTKPSGWDMHDWAEFYVEPWGWLPADPSYGLQKSDDPRVREFYLGHQDSYRLIVNRDYGSALEPAKRSLRSEPADFQRGEVEIDGKNLYFNQWEYEARFGWDVK
jgi:transglutaminase-like putative cysteine protease